MLYVNEFRFSIRLTRSGVNGEACRAFFFLYLRYMHKAFYATTITELLAIGIYCVYYNTRFRTGVIRIYPLAHIMSF